MYCISLFGELHACVCQLYAFTLAIIKIFIYKYLIYHITKMYMANGSWLRDIKKGMFVKIDVWV